MHRFATICVLALFAASATMAAVVADDALQLFDGHSLNGWKLSGPAGSLRATDGQIAARGGPAQLVYAGAGGSADLKNFTFEADVLTRPGARCGVAFHCRESAKAARPDGFEVRINNSRESARRQYDLPKTGSLVGFRQQFKPLAADGQWFRLRIEVRDWQVTTWINDRQIVRYDEPIVPAGVPQLPRQLSHGALALVCHAGHTDAQFKNLRLTRLPEHATGLPTRPTLDAHGAEILRLQQQGFPLIDFHTHLKGGLTLNEALDLSRQSGIQYGVAANCGLKFPITDDRGIDAFLKTMEGQPVFVGMQAEGREWPTLFSKQAVARFDYVFSDGMTIIDHRGRRARLWMPEEVDIPDPEAFMELLVRTIVGILSREPIDLYVNPTYLPDVLAPQYDRLWTPERLRKIIRAAAAHDVAIEISNRYRLPKPDFIRQAKAAGIRFTLGTNNADRQLGRCEYGIQMIRECGLTWQDMWMPTPEGRKPVQVRK